MDHKERLFSLALGVVSMATLMQEILLTRIFSVVTWYHYAFLAVSVAMFGMTVGAVAVFLLSKRIPDSRAGDLLPRFCLYFSFSVVVSCLAQIYLPFGSTRTVEYLGPAPVMQVISTLAGCLIISLPFFFSGMCLALIFRIRYRDIGKVYAADLVGAGLGCLLLPLTLDILDGPSAALLISVLGALSAYLFALSSSRRELQRTSGLTAAFFLFLTLVNLWTFRAGQPLLGIQEAKGITESYTLYEKWNSFSRVRIHGFPGQPTAPLVWGGSPRLIGIRPVEQLYLRIDGSAETVLTSLKGNDLDPLEYLRYDIINFVHHLRRDAKVAVVGAGGGRDILSGLVFDQQSILAVEINDAIVDLLTEKYSEFTGALGENPKVTIVNDEARSYLTRLQDLQDVIQISLIDTWAATSSGAYAFTENALYTVDAWKIFYSRLTPRGILSTSRWYSAANQTEMYRTFSLAMATLLELGVDDPGRHIMVVWNKDWGWTRVATLMLSRDPFTTEDIQRAREVSEDLFYEPAFLAGETQDPELARLSSAAGYREFLSHHEADLSAPTDDRPFFFQFEKPFDLLSNAFWERGVSSSMMGPSAMLLVLLLVFSLLNLGCIFVPLTLFGRLTVLKEAVPEVLYFSAVGMGFMLVEIGLLQRLNIFLGHPVYGLTVVLFSLLVAGGVGSYLTGMFSERSLSRSEMVYFPLLVLAIALAGAGLPGVIEQFRAFSTSVRIGVCLAGVLPLGVLMGMAFPLGVRRVSSRSGELIPWLWGINGATSVLASVLAMALVMSFGIGLLFWIAGGLYACAGLARLWRNRVAGSAQ